MSDHTSPFQARFILNPLHWPLWLGIGVLALTTLLPYRGILILGKGMAWLGFYLLPQRRRIMRTNLRLVFPELNDAAIRKLVKGSFYSASLMLFESMWAWWASDKKLRPLLRYDGLENLRAAEAKGKGVILLGVHFTHLEMLNRFMSYIVDNLKPTYKPARNSLFDILMTHNRGRLSDGMVSSRDMRGILKVLKHGDLTWYAPDQDFGSERSVFAPFMGVPTATLTMTARLAKASGAPVVPLYCERLPGTQGYHVHFGPALANFPSDDEVRDATAINAAIELWVQRIPDQYLWGHRRFKTRPRGEAQVYPPKRGFLRSYTLAHALLAGPLIGYTLWTALRQRDPRYLRERLGLTRPPAAEMIVHAASIGEVNAVIPLLELILARRPHTRILLTSNTPSGRHTAQQRLGERVRYAYMPIDWRWSVYRYLRLIDPRCVLIMETELWPNFAECCYSRGIRNVIINARLSSRSLNRPHVVRRWISQAIQYTYAILARSDEDARRYLSLAAAADYLKVLGNIKYASLSSGPTEAISLGREYVLVASSRDEEEKLLVQTWLALPGDTPMLVIVPRHIKRTPAILDDLLALTPAIAVRSRQERVTATTKVYLADTFGELKGFIQGARFVIMGGSFRAFGGQNIIEVAQAGKAVVFGPHMENFHSEAQAFIAATAAIQVEDQHQLALVLTSLLQDPQQLMRLGENGKRLTARYTHIADDYLKQLEQYCPLLTENVREG
jgi:lipid A biosynthesis lauroyl/palmitoleoyl acyltransferase